MSPHTLLSYHHKQNLILWETLLCIKIFIQNDNTMKLFVNLPLTIYPHTLRGIRGYKVIPEVAAYTQSH